MEKEKKTTENFLKHLDDILFDLDKNMYLDKYDSDFWYQSHTKRDELANEYSNYLKHSPGEIRRAMDILYESFEKIPELANLYNNIKTNILILEMIRDKYKRDNQNVKI